MKWGRGIFFLLFFPLGLFAQIESLRILPADTVMSNLNYIPQHAEIGLDYSFDLRVKSWAFIPISHSGQSSYDIDSRILLGENQKLYYYFKIHGQAFVRLLSGDLKVSEFALRSNGQIFIQTTNNNFYEFDMKKWEGYRFSQHVSIGLGRALKWGLGTALFVGSAISIFFTPDPQFAEYKGIIVRSIAALAGTTAYLIQSFLAAYRFDSANMLPNGFERLERANSNFQELVEQYTNRAKSQMSIFVPGCKNLFSGPKFRYNRSVTSGGFL